MVWIPDDEVSDFGDSDDEIPNSDYPEYIPDGVDLHVLPPPEVTAVEEVDVTSTATLQHANGGLLVLLQENDEIFSCSNALGSSGGPDHYSDGPDVDDLLMYQAMVLLI